MLSHLRAFLTIRCAGQDVLVIAEGPCTRCGIRAVCRRQSFLVSEGAFHKEVALTFSLRLLEPTMIIDFRVRPPFPGFEKIGILGKKKGYEIFPWNFPTTEPVNSGE